METSSNRWWEFYFVRYFVGTTLGAIIILFLAHSDSPVFANQGQIAPVLKLLKIEKFETGVIAALATIGLAFCYLASSPILVLHATRGELLKIRDSLSRWRSFIFLVLIFVVAGGQSYALWVAMRMKGNPWVSHDFYMGSLCLFIVSIVFVGQLFLLWLSFTGREKNAFYYYDDLVTKRADANEAGREYIESYRHLREHGNAFFIAFLELLLGVALFYSPIPWAGLLFLWIFPAVGVWFFGTLLENRKF